MSLLDAFFESLDRSAGDASGKDVALATVDPAYASGPAKVTFDGETALSTRTYPTIAGITAGSRVVMQRVGPAWVILGQIGGGPAPSVTKAQIDALAVDAGTLDGIDSTGFLRTTGKAADSDLLDGVDLATITAARLAQTALHGGGLVTWDGTYLKWSARFIAIAVGMGSHWSTGQYGGYFDIIMPASGTVIPGYGGSGNVTVNGSGIPLGGWNNLWAIPTVGGNNTQVSYAVTSYVAAFVVPSHWILVAAVSGDDGRVKLGTGEILDYWRGVSFTNGWVQYADPAWGVVGYRKDAGGWVHLRGMIGSGVAGQSAFNLPAGYRPGFNPIVSVPGDGVFTEIRMYQDGLVIPQIARSWISLSSIPPFMAEQ